jgi:hypothetical protein
MLQAVDAHREHLDALLAPACTYMDLNIGAALWLAAAAEGWVTHPDGGGDPLETPVEFEGFIVIAIDFFRTLLKPSVEFERWNPAEKR